MDRGENVYHIRWNFRILHLLLGKAAQIVDVFRLSEATTVDLG